jgi:hypothetical protein
MVGGLVIAKCLKILGPVFPSLIDKLVSRTGSPTDHSIFYTNISITLLVRFLSNAEFRARNLEETSYDTEEDMHKL